LARELSHGFTALAWLCQAHLRVSKF
jgi:hypothetical protein